MTFPLRCDKLFTLNQYLETKIDILLYFMHNFLFRNLLNNPVTLLYNAPEMCMFVVYNIVFPIQMSGLSFVWIEYITPVVYYSFFHL